MSEPGRLAVDALVTSWTRALRARNLASKTIVSYTDTVERLTTFALERDLDPLSRRAVEDYLADVASRFKPATVSFRYRALQQWFGWLTDEDELEVNPMAKMRAPQVPEQPVDILSPDQQRALLAAADGRDFADRRDTAVLHLFIDTGMRLGELTGIQLGDVDLDVDNVVIVTGKGRRTRACPFGVKTAKALDRYLRARARHPLADSPALWLGDRGRGPLTDSGITQILRRRAKEAGIGRIHPHMFRHTFAHSWREAGGGDAELMRLAGWKSRQMLQRYGAAAADARAREAHRRLSPGDRL